MHRDSWGDIDGMLFVFERERNRAFWMKNTKLPMDIIFFDADGMVTTIIQSAQPFDETLIQSASPSQFVLEIPAGNAGKLGIDESTRLEITPALREQ